MDRFGDMLIAEVPRLRRYARALTRNVSHADDLVQDCLERAWSRAHRWRQDSDLRAWLFTIMHNLHVNAVRRQHRRPELVPLEDDEPAASTAPQQEDGLMLRDLQTALAALPDEQREVLLLVALEGMSYEEVAAILDLPLGTVMSRLYRARERMRRSVIADPAVPSLRRVK
jgi:RNA polymerase sigma-70 factor (ECF subfamily)